MALTSEWRGRVEQWRDTLPKLFYRKLGDVTLAGFVTSEQLPVNAALRRKFRTMPEGTPWGGAWEYGWFKGSFRLPAGARGQNIVFRYGQEHKTWVTRSGGDARVLVNGRETGEIDWAHPEVPLTHRGVPGTTYKIMMEVYAGHGPYVWHVGPLPEGMAPIPEIPARQLTVEPCSFGIWEEEIFQAWMDVQTLFLLRDNLDPDSMRVAEIDEGLKAFTVKVDLELPHEAMMRTIRAGRRVLQPLLACRNGSTAPDFYCFGHSHIDVAWLWPLQETERKVARTFSTQLGLMREYPEFRFLQSQAYLYRIVKQKYPALYREIKAAVRRGQFIPEGGMWVEADTNVTGGESLIRQFMHGLRFFKEEFGVDSKLMWLPDVFGYSGAIPQLIKGCGLEYFSTHKIFWTYNGGDPFPYNTFLWEGIDGTRVLSHIHNDYNSPTDPATLIQRWKMLAQKEGTRRRLIPFGHGDGGGGVTRTHLEYLRRQRDLEGAPKTRMSHPVDFFVDEKRDHKHLPVYVGELYYQAHRGTYTTQARTKRGNRTSEFALRSAECWGAVAQALGKIRYPVSVMEDAWKDVLLNQFHDIIPGSSIERVYREAEALYGKVLQTVERITNKTCRSLVKSSNGSVTAFNSLSWERMALVPVPAAWKGAEDADGCALPVQRIDGVNRVLATLPSCGWATVRQGKAVTIDGGPLIDGNRMENEHLRVRFNDRGEIVSLKDKASGEEFVAGPMNALRMYRDNPRGWEAWDVDSNYACMPVPLDQPATLRVVARGPLAVVMRVERKINKSKVVQDIWLCRGSRRLEFRTRVDWREQHKLLKVEFPTGIHANEALHEIQFGHIARPNHRSRPFDADRFEVCNQKWTALCEANRGVAVLNDCKYGVNVDGGSINLTLLRAPKAPDATADQGMQEFTYAVHAWRGGWMDSRVVREGYELNTPVEVVPGDGGRVSWFTLDAGNIVIDTVKPAEDGSGDLVVRLYETKRTATTCCLTTALPIRKVVETNLLEVAVRAMAVSKGMVNLAFKPFEIKTLRIKVAFRRIGTANRPVSGAGRWMRNLK